MRKNLQFVVAVALVAIFLITAAPARSLAVITKLPAKTFTDITPDIWRNVTESQGRAGTCWCFSTVSAIESEGNRLNGYKYELSELYVVYYAYIEKANRYLRLRGKSNFSQGGLSHDLLKIIPKYGIVPVSDYSGLKEGETVHQHGQMVSMLKAYLDQLMANRGVPPENWREGFRAILDMYIGRPPDTIVVDGVEMTPKQFADDVLKFNPDDYIEFTSYSYMPFYSFDEMLVPDNWLAYKNFYNLPLDDFMSVVDYALEKGVTFAIDSDWSEENISKEVGYAVTEEELEGKVIAQAERDQMFDDRRTTDDHLLHAVGIAKDENGGKFYRIKNSHGLESTPFQGDIYYSENFFKAKVLAFLVHKDGVPPQILEKIEKGE